MTPEEHVARCMLLPGKLVYDRYTNSYRPISPEGSKYKYSGCIDAGTLEPLDKGVALQREKEKGCGNTISMQRSGLSWRQTR